MSANRSQWFYTMLGYLVILLLLVFVAVIIGAGVSWMVNHGVRPWQKSFENWLGFALFTPALFWVIIKRSRRFWHRRSFWVTIGCLLSVHSAGFRTLFRYIDEWRAFYFLAII